MREVWEIGLVEYFIHWTHYALGKRILRCNSLQEPSFVVVLCKIQRLRSDILFTREKHIARKELKWKMHWFGWTIIQLLNRVCCFNDKSLQLKTNSFQNMGLKYEFTRITISIDEDKFVGFKFPDTADKRLEVWKQSKNFQENQNA